jgi:hypothetical protein
MKKIKEFLKISIVLVHFSAAVNGQASNSTNIGVFILPGISFSETSSLHFGTMTSPAAQATVVLKPDGTRTSATSIDLLAQSPESSPAAYVVTGGSNTTYVINLPLSDITITCEANSQTMIVNNFTSSKIMNTGGLNSSGTDAFSVGASLLVEGDQATGNYSGTFDISIAYN